MRFRLNRTFFIPVFSSLLLLTLSIASPVLAYCCKCTSKTTPGTICLTDTAGFCGDIVSRNSVNTNLSSVSSCESLPDAQCVSISGGGSTSGVCTIGPVAATAFAPTTDTQKPAVIGVINAPKLNVDIPGLSFADNIQMYEGAPASVPFLAQYITAVYNYLLGISVIAAAIMIVYGGFKYIVSSSFEGVKSGKQIITDAVVGLLLVFGCYTILAVINPVLVVLKPLSVPVIKKAEFAHSIEHVGEGIPISGTPATLNTEGRPDYKDLKDRSGKGPNFPPPDSDGSCNPIAGIPAYDFKQYSGEWAAQSTGLLPVCSKTKVVDAPDNTNKEVEASYYNDIPHDGSGGGPQPPCCTPYSYSACGVSSAAIVLAAYGEMVNPGTAGEMVIQQKMRTCNYGGMNPIATLRYFTDYEYTSIPRDAAKITTELKAGRPIIFACSNCRGADALSLYQVNGRTLGNKLGSKGYGGHFMVLTGVYSDGNFAVADPGGTMNYIQKSTILDPSKVMSLIQIKRKDGKPIKACQ